VPRLLGDNPAWPGFYMAEILDPANSKRSYGSSEKDTDREPAAADVAAAGHLVSSLSTAAYIPWELNFSLL